MSTVNDQNSDESINLLAARRQLYSEAKRYHFARLTSAMVLALAAPAVIALLTQLSNHPVYGPTIQYLLPGVKTLVAMISGMMVLVSTLVAAEVESAMTRQAAVVQEQFDTAVFGLPWNEILVGPQVIQESIRSAAGRQVRDRDHFRNWYPDTQGIPYPLGILLCQRANSVWDSRLRRHYASWFGMGTGALFTVGVMLAILLNLSFVDYLMTLLIPSLPALTLGFGVTRDHFKAAERRERVVDVTSKLWKDGLRDLTLVPLESCRQIQDVIYMSRCSPALVPDFWYRRVRERFNEDMRSTGDGMREQAKTALTQIGAQSKRQS